MNSSSQTILDMLTEVLDLVTEGEIKNMKRDGILTDLKYRVLDLSRCITSKKSKKSETRNKLSNRKWKAALKKVNRAFIHYDKYRQLHDLWSGYVRNILKQSTDIKSDLLVADFRGALIVDAEKSPVRGFLIGESKNCFTVITSASKRKTVIKDGYFKLQTNFGYGFYVFGQNMRIRPELRNGKVRRFLPVKMPPNVKSTIEIQPK